MSSRRGSKSKSKESSKPTTTKRQAIREKRRQQQRRQRLILILAIAGIALLIAGGLIYSQIKQATTPVGEFTRITPVAHPMASGRTLGDPNAPVTIEVYEDFQCPSCQRYSQEVAPKIIAEYITPESAQIYYVYRQFPFLDDRALAKESDQSANASMCAAEQERFWDYHDMLFANWNGENQGAFNDKRLVAFAEALGLDMDQFNTCFENNTYEDEINTDLAMGKSIGVSGTPSVFVNGELLTPGYIPSFGDIKRAVDAILASQ